MAPRSRVRATSLQVTEEPPQQLSHLSGLFLLNPVPRSIQQMATTHIGEGAVLHPLDRSGRLVNSPVTHPGNKHRGNIDGTTMKNLQLAVANILSAASVPL